MSSFAEEALQDAQRLYKEAVMDAQRLKKEALKDLDEARKRRDDCERKKGADNEEYRVYAQDVQNAEQRVQNAAQPLKDAAQILKDAEQRVKEAKQEVLKDAEQRVQNAPLVFQTRKPCEIPFYNSIVNVAEKADWLEFEQEIPSIELKRLFVRDSYRSIASQIQDRVNVKNKKTIITGTPGIGKSMFLIYYLCKLVKAGKRVLFIYHPDTIYYDGQGGVFELGSPPPVWDHQFWTSDLWCLFDAKSKKEEHLGALPYNVCAFVLSTSPRRELVNDFKKPPSPRNFYMPVWTEKELKIIAPSCFPTVIHWHNRFNILGGIPRYVLEDLEDEPTALLQQACNQCDLNDCIKIIGLNSTITDKNKVVHSLVHIISVPPFTKPSVDFASQTALALIVEAKGKEAKHRMVELLESCAGNPLTAALCGYIFEPYAIELLEKGGTFDCHVLVGGKKKAKSDETRLSIPSSMKLVVEKVEENQTHNQLHVPKNKNYAGIDAWIPGIGAFQMTVGKKHSIHASAEDNLAMLGNGANKLYWLLPPLHYKSFTKVTPQTIDQYAVKIPYPSVDS